MTTLPARPTYHMACDVFVRTAELSILSVSIYLQRRPERVEPSAFGCWQCRVLTRRSGLEVTDTPSDLFKLRV